MEEALKCLEELKRMDHELAMKRMELEALQVLKADRDARRQAMRQPPPPSNLDLIETEAEGLEKAMAREIEILRQIGDCFERLLASRRRVAARKAEREAAAAKKAADEADEAADISSAP